MQATVYENHLDICVDERELTLFYNALQKFQYTLKGDERGLCQLCLDTMAAALLDYDAGRRNKTQ